MRITSYMCIHSGCVAAADDDEDDDDVDDGDVRCITSTFEIDR